MAEPTEGGHVRLLVTCTANRVRSPLAAGLLRQRVAEAGLPVLVGSAGQLEGGRSAVEEMASIAARMGVDLEGHRSTQLSAELVDSCDLIVTMSGQHVIDMVGLSPASGSRTITLKEWASAVERGHPITDWSRDGVRRWAAERTQRPLDVLLSGELDIEDPIGRSRRHYRRAAQEIQDLIAIFLR